MASPLVQFAERKGVGADRHRLTGAEPGHADGNALQRIIFQLLGAARHSDLARFPFEEDFTLDGILDSLVRHGRITETVRSDVRARLGIR